MKTTQILLLCFSLLFLISLVLYLRYKSKKAKYEENISFVETNLPYWIVNKNNFRIFRVILSDIEKANRDKEKYLVLKRQFEDMYIDFLNK